MDAFASPSIRRESLWGSPSRLIEAAVLTLVLGLSLVSFPDAPDTNLDASWQVMLIRAHAQGLQFGRDVIFTWGPWGFLCSRYHLGSLQAVPMLAWQVGGQLLIALGLVALTGSLPAWRRIAFIGALLAFHWLFLDVVYFVLIALIGIAGLMRRDAGILRLAAWTLALGFLSQLKFTYLVISSAAVLSAMAYWGSRRSWARLLVIPVGYAFSVVAAWIAAGQDPDNLFPYIRRSIEIASGYGDAMGMDESWPLFCWGATLMVICAAFVWQVWRRVAERPLALGASGLLAFTLFVMWKESFTRADMVPLGGHIFGIFTLVLILAPVVPGLLFPERRWHWFDLSVLYCALGIGCFDRDYYLQGPAVAWQMVRGSALSLARLGSLPSEWQEQFERACAAASLPRVCAEVGQHSVDVYNFSIGVAILNGLNFTPRPIFQGYSAYTPSLQGWNLRHYQSDRAPDFLLWKDERVDNRYPGMDDAPLVAGLPGHYEALFAEGGYWLFKRVSPLSKAPPVRSALLSRTVSLSEEIYLPADLDRAVWLEADPVPNALGRVRALLYKPAAVHLVTTDDHGKRMSWRLPPRIAASGFLIVPTLEGGGDLAALARGRVHSWVKSFHFEAAQGQEEFWKDVKARVYGLPGLPLPRLEDTHLIELGIFDRPALSVTSAAAQQVVETPDGPALLLHAEGQVLFEVPPGATRVSFDFGIREGAYTGEGRTDGVAFDADAVLASGERRHLWGRYLDPLSNPADRGTQRTEVMLPTDGALRLRLHTGPGPANDSRWDWSYVSRIRFDGPATK